MSDAPMVSEKVAVLRERRAFVLGANKEFDALSSDNAIRFDIVESWPVRRSRREHDAIVCYKMPRVRQPRAPHDPHVGGIRWSCIGGAISGEAFDAGHWYGITQGHSAFTPTPERVKLWADLFTTPDEEVESE